MLDRIFTVQPTLFSLFCHPRRAWFLIFTLSVAINCSITIFFAFYCISMEGWKLLYIIGLIEALIFCGLGWLLSGFTVKSATCWSVATTCLSFKCWQSLKFLVFCSLTPNLLQLLYAAMNLTTNEMFNYKRYSYLKNARGKYYNPYSRGLFMNLAEFFLCVSPVEPEELRGLELT